MDPFIGWPPIFWMLRIGILVVLAGGVHVFVLLIAPFFRPAHVLRMLKADIPRVRSLGAEIAGTRGEVEFESDAEQRIAAIEERVDRVLEQIAAPFRQERADGGTDAENQSG